ncbi:protease inhibitor I42 family protein [Streptomyces sp. NPDC086549]|uniref:protease inhibitor I42 family protein n=1 Tax=Streptomyces sp. NPDC086549 TaxID=3365752 RepID=UPI003808294D
MTGWEFGEADNGREVAAAPGDVIAITVPESPTTGYRWEVVSPLDGILALVESRYRPGPDDGFGGGGLRRFAFRAAAPGSTTVVLVCRRPWEPHDAYLWEYRLTVRAN